MSGVHSVVKEVPEFEGEKYWDLEWKFIDNALLKEMGTVLESLEEAFFLKGKAEGQQYAMELTKATGFLLAYKILLEDKKGQTLEKELEKNGKGHGIKDLQQHIDKSKDLIAAAKKKLKIYNDDALKPEMLLALSLYTAESCYGIVNKALRVGGQKGGAPILVEWCMFISNFIQGFRLLPSYWGPVFRGANLDPTTFKKDKVILFENFTSTSRRKDRALWFMRRKLKGMPPLPPEAKHVLFVMDSKSGRKLDDLSHFLTEEEVVFRPFTSFLVQSVTDKKDDKGEYVEVQMTEAHPDTRGRKVLIWVDDAHGDESKLIMDICERTGVTCVHKTSTKETVAFFEQQDGLIKRGIHRMRIITDMVRKEDGKKLNIEAGLDLVKQLASKFGYREPVVIFTGSQYLKPNRQKFVDAGLTHAYVTATRSEAQTFAKFEPLTGVVGPAPPTPVTEMPVFGSSSSNSSLSIPSSPSSDGGDLITGSFPTGPSTPVSMDGSGGGFSSSSASMSSSSSS